jgi:hypothetical protein
MKLAELQARADRRADELSDLQIELFGASLHGSGSDDDKKHTIDLLRRTMELWDEVDEMDAYIASVKSSINIPSLGMSILDAELVADSQVGREDFLDVLAANIIENGAGQSEDEDDVNRCPHCGDVRGTPIKVGDVWNVMGAVRGRREALLSIIDQTLWQVETTWHDDDDEQEMSSESVSEPRVNPVEELGIGELDGEFLRPAVVEPEPEPIQGDGYRITDPSCPFCTSPNRKLVEEMWMKTFSDTMGIMEYSQRSGLIPLNVNPSMARLHFDDHFNASDHLTNE